MATYVVNMYSTTNNTATMDEQMIYGASRVGLLETGKVVYNNGTALPTEGPIWINQLGNRRYEVGNWLGNVNAVVTDRKIVSSPGSPSIYEAVVKMKSDYYPFGMEMPGRSVTTSDYRYGYNGMEKDKEISGNGNSYTTEFRQYDPRLGRWKSLDPLMMKYPSMSPYVAFNNNPIYFVDPLGLEGTNPGDPPVGSTCVDEQGATLKYEGDGNWTDVTPVKELDEVTIVATRDFSINGKKPTFNMDHGHCQDYPEIGYDYTGQREPTAAERRSERWWNFKAFGATLIRWDLGNALPAYKHFQDASGTDYTVDFEDYFDDDPSAETLLNTAVGIAKKSAEKLVGIDETINMTSIGYSSGSYSDPRFPYPQTEDWQKAIGAFNFYMTAKVTSTVIYGKINYTMELTIHLVDRYNFNPGMSDIATGTPDGDNGVFEVTGLGKEFNQYGTYTTTITWSE